jgi:hypothetical protein
VEEDDAPAFARRAATELLTAPGNGQHSLFVALLRLPSERTSLIFPDVQPGSRSGR